MTQSRPVSANRRRYNLGTFIGRMEPPTEAHRFVIERGLEVADELMIGLGSANAARRFDYVPFTAAEREQMIRLTLTPEQNRRVHFAHLEDQGNTPKWATIVRGFANQIEPDDSKITLVGHSKDHSSFYLKHFPGWAAKNVESYSNGLSATTYRQRFFSPDFEPSMFADGGLHPEVIAWLFDFRRNSPWYGHLVEEAVDVAETIKKYGRGPHLAADAIIIFGDKVLVIERGKPPFKGYICSPGGFVNPSEDVVEAALREQQKEEAKILKVPAQVIRDSYVATESFHSPWRDPRGRIVTFASLFHLKPRMPVGITDPEEIASFMKEPRVRAGDDAAKAYWKSINSIRREECAFDFYIMLHRMLEYIRH